MSLITPENLPAVLTAIGGMIAAIGGITWWRSRNDPPKPGTTDAAAVALAENTRATLAMVEALKDQNANFAENNEMFRAIGHEVGAVARDLADMRRDLAASKDHLASIRDAQNRRG